MKGKHALMLNKTVVACAIGLGLTFSVTSTASVDVEVEWKDPSEYRDVKPTSGSRKKFRESTFRYLESYMHELAQDLPSGSSLKFVVTELDLAGQVWPASFAGFQGAGTEVRIVKSVDIPRIHFSYTLVNSTGSVVLSDSVKLKDLRFMNRASRFFPNDRLSYEKNMLKHWFHSTFKDLKAKNET